MHFPLTNEYFSHAKKIMVEDTVGQTKVLYTGSALSRGGQKGSRSTSKKDVLIQNDNVDEASSFESEELSKSSEESVSI